jgi:hypothetical protein
MTATLTTIRQGLAANLSTLTGIQVSAYMLAQPTPPTIHLYPAQVTYDLAAARGLDQWDFTVQAFVGDTADQGAQVALDAFIAPSGAQSVKRALEVPDGGSPRTYLGGIAGDVSALTCSGYRIYTRPGSPSVLGAEWTVRVLAAGN